FSSRRRHTRFSRDWSSDVCSSDLYSDRSADWRTLYNRIQEDFSFRETFTQLRLPFIDEISSCRIFPVDAERHLACVAARIVHRGREQVRQAFTGTAGRFSNLLIF